MPVPLSVCATFGGGGERSARRRFGMHQKRKIWPFCLKNRLQTGDETARRRVPGAVQTSPAPARRRFRISGREKTKNVAFCLRNLTADRWRDSGRDSGMRQKRKMWPFVSKIDCRQVAGQPDAVFRVQYKPLPPPHGGPPGSLAAKKREIWPFCLKNRLQTGGGTTANESAPRTNEKSGLFVLKIDYRQAPRLRAGLWNASKTKNMAFCLKNRLQTGGGTAGRRVPGAVQTSPTPARRRSRGSGREEKKNLAFLS